MISENIQRLSDNIIGASSGEIERLKQERGVLALEGLALRVREYRRAERH